LGFHWFALALLDARVPLRPLRFVRWRVRKGFLHVRLEHATTPKLDSIEDPLRGETRGKLKPK
jgi:hypothetical protein